MKIGEMGQFLLLILPSQIEEAGGAGTYDSFQEIAWVYGKIEAVNGLIQLDTKQIGEEITHKITIRYYPLISTKHAVKMGDRYFEIKNVKNIDERNQYLELLVRENGHFIDTLQVDEPIDEPLES
jgi:SPP1 family predicted phage head-tail adaptor